MTMLVLFQYVVLQRLVQFITRQLCSIHIFNIFNVKTLLHVGGIATGGGGDGGEGVIKYTGMLQGKCRSCPLADCSGQPYFGGRKILDRLKLQ